jgi:hypothetical protein
MALKRGIVGSVQLVAKIIYAFLWGDRSWVNIMVSMPLFFVTASYVVSTFYITAPLVLVWILVEARRNVDYLSIGARKLKTELEAQFSDDSEGNDLMDGVAGAALTANQDGPTTVYVKTDKTVVKSRSAAAMRLAFAAISKVGYLDNTRVNAKIYEKTILKEMELRGWRYTDRVKILPMAVCCCFLKDQETRDAMELLSSQMRGISNL